MIRRVYADNYRSLVNFEWEPSAETLMLGLNGSGKTTVLDVISQLQSGACGWHSYASLFGSGELTAWTRQETMRFELDLEVGSDLFRYRVEIECRRSEDRAAVRLESLRRGEETVFTRNLEAVALSETPQGLASNFPLDRSQSVVAAVQSSGEGSPLAVFRDALSRILIVRPLPPNMKSEAKQEDAILRDDMENFVGWYRNMATSQKFASDLQRRLKEVWPEFDYLNLERSGRDSRTLEVYFESSSRSIEPLRLDFTQLSDGERMLVALYALATYQNTQAPTTIILDEPDNYVGLPELQPWLLSFLDDRPEGGQIILVSHNPEIMNSVGEKRVAYFERSDHHAPTRVHRLKPDRVGLPLSERIARNWMSDEEPSQEAERA